MQLDFDRISLSLLDFRSFVEAVEQLAVAAEAAEHVVEADVAQVVAADVEKHILVGRSSAQLEQDLDMIADEVGNSEPEHNLAELEAEVEAEAVEAEAVAGHNG
jgi:hypothetical protein